MGRPIIITPEITTEICRQLAEGSSLISICEQDDMPNKSTVLMWVVKGHAGDERYKDFIDQYAQAREANGHAHADRIIKLTEEVTEFDGLDANRARVAIDGLKWAAERMASKSYAPKVQGTGKDGAFKVQLSTEDQSVL